MEHGITKGRAWLDRLEIGTICAAETEVVLDVVARGMRDNPQHVAPSGRTPRPGDASFAG